MLLFAFLIYFSVCLHSYLLLEFDWKFYLFVNRVLLNAEISFIGDNDMTHYLCLVYDSCMIVFVPAILK